MRTDRAPKTKNLWLDDLRPVPRDFPADALVATSARQAMDMLSAAVKDGYRFKEISLDHDLGEGHGKADNNGMMVLDFMARENIWPDVLTIHTANPPARKRMLAAANNDAPPRVRIEIRYWDRYQG